MFSLFHFLRLQPYGNIEWWNNAIIKPIKAKQEHGLSRLKSILSLVLLRRTKTEEDTETSMKILPLPRRIVKERKLEFDPLENAFYQELWQNSKTTFESICREKKDYAHVLELLLRLRQACDHPWLVVKSKEAHAQNPDAMVTDFENDALNHANWKSMSSSKIEALLYELHLIKKEDPSIKSIVFSQWTSM